METFVFFLNLDKIFVDE